MINSTNAAVQTVESTKNVLFSNDRIRTNSCKSCCEGWLSHDLGSGLFTITKPGIYEIGFNANVATPTDVELNPITLNITNAGESISGGEMVTTPAAVEEYYNVAATILLRVTCNSSVTISIKNNSANNIFVSQANLFIIREA